MCVQAKEWDVALFDFHGQTAEDLSFHEGAIIQVTQSGGEEDWRAGRGSTMLPSHSPARVQPGTTHTHTHTAETNTRPKEHQNLIKYKINFLFNIAFMIILMFYVLQKAFSP